MKNIFIDSNIWIPLYGYNHKNITEIMKLHPLMGDTIKIWLPEQVEDEVYRNRDNILQQSFKDIKSMIPNIPYILQEFEGFTDIVTTRNTFEEQFNTIYGKFEEAASERNLLSDKTIANMFNSCERIKQTDEIVTKALINYQRGNPPGKGQSFGDAINWFTLLENVPNGEDLYFISNDGDFKSKLNKSKFDSFLEKEWRDVKNSDIIFYNDLQNFLRVNFEEIQFTSEAMSDTKLKDSLISELEESGSFTETHYIVGKLSGYEDWSLSQKQRILQAAEDNFQVSYIRKDYDISAFLSKVIAYSE